MLLRPFSTLSSVRQLDDGDPAPRRTRAAEETRECSGRSSAFENLNKSMPLLFVGSMVLKFSPRFLLSRDEFQTICLSSQKPRLKLRICMEQQGEFLYASGTDPLIEVPDPRAGFYSEVAKVWLLLLGQRARIELRGHDLPEITGRLELIRAPDLPLNPHEPLHLCIGGISFMSTHVLSWSVVG
jgi:hypothetical protein